MGKKGDDFWRKEYKKFLETTKSNPTKGGGSVIPEYVKSSILESFTKPSLYPSISGPAVASGSGYWPSSSTSFPPPPVSKYWWAPVTGTFTSSSTWTSIGHFHFVVTKCHWSDDGARLYIDEWDNTWDSCGDPPPNTTFRSDEDGVYIQA